MRRTGGVLLVFALLGTLVAGSGLAATPPVIAAAALLPPLGFAGVVVLLDRRDREPWMALAAAFLWGAAVAAPVSRWTNDLILATPALAPAAPGLLGPAVEEVAKASALLVVLGVWRRTLADPVDGIVYGALAGLGFAAMENVGYYVLASLQGGAAGFARAVWLRGVLQGLNHAAFTATTGAAVGWAVARRDAGPARGLVVALGVGLALLVHAVWNAIAAAAITQVLCAAPAPGAPCAPAPARLDLLLTVPVLVGTFVGPTVAALVAIAATGAASRVSGRGS